jgi:sugar phosphate isomerase/epimerase
MPALKDLEIGLIFWGERNPRLAVRGVKSLGLRCGHLGIAGHVPIREVAPLWKAALAEEDFAVTTIFAAYEGESYADAPTVQRTVGFIPPATRGAREVRTLEVIDLAAELGVPGFACHIGFIPEDPSAPDRIVVRDIVRRICDYTARRRMTFALETGQETAHALKAFIEEVERDNLRVNFDPANLVLYGTGDPIDALRVLAPWVVSVHVKDGLWPPSDKPGSLGTETPLGQGRVGIDRFVATLKAIGYKGPLTIEREVSLEQDMDDRHKEGLSHLDDIRNAIRMLEQLRSA